MAHAFESPGTFKERLDEAVARVDIEYDAAQLAQQLAEQGRKERLRKELKEQARRAYIFGGHQSPDIQKAIIGLRQKTYSQLKDVRKYLKLVIRTGIDRNREERNAVLAAKQRKRDRSARREAGLRPEDAAQLAAQQRLREQYQQQIQEEALSLAALVGSQAPAAPGVFGDAAPSTMSVKVPVSVQLLVDLKPTVPEQVIPEGDLLGLESPAQPGAVPWERSVPPGAQQRIQELGVLDRPPSREAPLQPPPGDLMALSPPEGGMPVPQERLLPRRLEFTGVYDRPTPTSTPRQAPVREDVIATVSRQAVTTRRTRGIYEFDPLEGAAADRVPVAPRAGFARLPNVVSAPPPSPEPEIVDLASASSEEAARIEEREESGFPDASAASMHSTFPFIPGRRGHFLYSAPDAVGKYLPDRGPDSDMEWSGGTIDLASPDRSKMWHSTFPFIPGRRGHFPYSAPDAVGKYLPDRGPDSDMELSEGTIDLVSSDRSEMWEQVVGPPLAESSRLVDLPDDIAGPPQFRVPRINVMDPEGNVIHIETAMDNAVAAMEASITSVSSMLTPDIATPDISISPIQLSPRTVERRQAWRDARQGRPAQGSPVDYDALIQQLELSDPNRTPRIPPPPPVAPVLPQEPVAEEPVAAWAPGVAANVHPAPLVDYIGMDQQIEPDIRRSVQMTKEEKKEAILVEEARALSEPLKVLRERLDTVRKQMGFERPPGQAASGRLEAMRQAARARPGRIPQRAASGDVRRRQQQNKDIFERSPAAARVAAQEVPTLVPVPQANIQRLMRLPKPVQPVRKAWKPASHPLLAAPRPLRSPEPVPVPEPEPVMEQPDQEFVRRAIETEAREAVSRWRLEENYGPSPPPPRKRAKDHLAEMGGPQLFPNLKQRGCAAACEDVQAAPVVRSPARSPIRVTMKSPVRAPAGPPAQAPVRISPKPMARSPQARRTRTPDDLFGLPQENVPRAWRLKDLSPRAEQYDPAQAQQEQEALQELGRRVIQEDPAQKEARIKALEEAFGRPLAQPVLTVSPSKEELKARARQRLERIKKQMGMGASRAQVGAAPAAQPMRRSPVAGPSGLQQVQRSPPRQRSPSPVAGPSGLQQVQRSPPRQRSPSPVAGPSGLQQRQRSPAARTPPGGIPEMLRPVPADKRSPPFFKKVTGDPVKLFTLPEFAARLEPGYVREEAYRDPFPVPYDEAAAEAERARRIAAAGPRAGTPAEGPRERGSPGTARSSSQRPQPGTVKKSVLKKTESKKVTVATSAAPSASARRVGSVPPSAATGPRRAGGAPPRATPAARGVAATPATRGRPGSARPAQRR